MVGHAPRAKSRVEKGDRLDLDEEKKKRSGERAAHHVNQGKIGLLFYLELKQESSPLQKIITEWQ